MRKRLDEGFRETNGVTRRRSNRWDNAEVEASSAFWRPQLLRIQAGLAIKKVAVVELVKSSLVNDPGRAVVVRV